MADMPPPPPIVLDLTDQGIARFLGARSEALRTTVRHQEGKEPWTVDRDPDIAVLLEHIGARMTAHPEVVGRLLENPRFLRNTRIALCGMRAGKRFATISWLVHRLPDAVRRLFVFNKAELLDDLEGIAIRTSLASIDAVARRQLIEELLDPVHIRQMHDILRASHEVRSHG